MIIYVVSSSLICIYIYKSRFSNAKGHILAHWNRELPIIGIFQMSMEDLQDPKMYVSTKNQAIFSGDIYFLIYIGLNNRPDTYGNATSNLLGKL